MNADLIISLCNFGLYLLIIIFTIIIQYSRLVKHLCSLVNLVLVFYASKCCY